MKGHDTSKVETMEPVMDRIIKVKFNADVASSMRWNFRPQQSQVQVHVYGSSEPFTFSPLYGVSLLMLF